MSYLDVLFSRFPGRTKAEKQLQDSRHPGQDLNARPSEHEAAQLQVVLTKTA